MSYPELEKTASRFAAYPHGAGGDDSETGCWDHFCCYRRFNGFNWPAWLCLALSPRNRIADRILSGILDVLLKHPGSFLLQLREAIHCAEVRAYDLRHGTNYSGKP